MDNKTIHISQPFLGEEEWQALRGPLESGWLTQGPQVAEFEKAVAKHQNVNRALATTSCTTALHLILVALGIGPGDEVIVPALTWVATANVVLYCGATPIFVDVDSVTYNMDVNQIAEKVTPNTKAIIPVHLFGLCADIDGIVEAAPNIAIVEDAACAIGGAYKGIPAGKLGIAGAFSFHPRKMITTGEGGMITTDDIELAEKMNCLRNHGASISEEQRHHGPRPYLLPDFNVLGFNYRMTDMQAAVGLVQMSRLETLLAERNQWAQYYNNALNDLAWLRTPVTPPEYQHGWQAYVCYLDETQAPDTRNAIMEKLQAKGISVRPGTHAVHMLDLYRQRYGFNDGDFPVARDCDRYTIALPLHNHMTKDDYDYVIETLFTIGG